MGFINDVAFLASLVLVREGTVGDLHLEELAESLPALAHPVDQELGGGHQGLHCGVVSPVLVQPDTLVEVEYISKLQEMRESLILGLLSASE